MSIKATLPFESLFQNVSFFKHKTQWENKQTVQQSKQGENAWTEKINKLFKITYQPLWTLYTSTVEVDWEVSPTEFNANTHRIAALNVMPT